MRPLKIVVLYLGAVIVLSALLSPWLFYLVQWLDKMPCWPAAVAPPPFRRVHDRTALVVAALALWPLLRGLGIRSWREVGFVRMSAGWRHVAWGVALGVVSFALIGAMLLALGARRFDAHWMIVTRYLLKFALTGIVVAFIEETLFRGGLLGALTRAGNITLAIIITSLLYALAHFLKPTELDVPANAVNWLSGFWYSGQILRWVFRSPGDVLGFVTLFLAGSVLAVARVRTGALYLSLGLHCGWVFTQKTFSFMTDWTGFRAWWGGGELVNNLLVWPLLVLLLWVVVRLTKPPIATPS